jgi:hypothetical protein
MNAHEELNPKNSSQANGAATENGAAAASQDDQSSLPPEAAELGGAEPTRRGPSAGAPEIESPQLHLIPYLATSQSKAASGPATAVRWISGLAAGLALLAAVTAVGLYDHARQSNMLAAKAEESRSLAQTVKGLKDRIDVITAARARDETADLRRVAAELKSESSATHDFSSTLAQLTARVDRIDRDQSARLDKLADRIDHESAARIAELTARLEKLERKPPVAVVAALPSPTPIPAPKPIAVVPKADPGVSNETTGSIERPRGPLRGYKLLEVQDDFAVVAGPNGPQQVGPGQYLPGAGRVLRVERRGQDWVLVTSAGFIAGDQPRF